MTRSLHLFNAVLGLAAVALGAGVVRMVLDRGSSVVGSPPAAAVSPATAPGTAGVNIETTAVGLPDEPDVLLIRYPFGKPLPEPVKPLAPPRVIPPPEPLPTLIGTLSVGSQSRALLKDGSRTDLFATGDAVAGGTLVEIHADRVVIKRGDGLREVSLKSTIVEKRGQQSTSAPPEFTPVTPESASIGEPAESRPWRRQRVSRQRPPAASTPPAADNQ